MKAKLGPHHQKGSADSARWLQHTTVAKAVGDLGVLLSAPGDCLTVGRLVDDGLLWGQGFDANRYVADGAQPVALAHAYFEFVLAEKIRLNPWVRVWEGPNEQIIEQSHVMGWYAVFWQELARLIAEQAMNDK